VLSAFSRRRGTWHRLCIVNSSSRPGHRSAVNVGAYGVRVVPL
jgi:hypothetical protein